MSRALTVTARYILRTAIRSLPVLGGTCTQRCTFARGPWSCRAPPPPAREPAGRRPTVSPAAPRRLAAQVTTDPMVVILRRERCGFPLLGPKS